jgi:hypothetical protein
MTTSGLPAALQRTVLALVPGAEAEGTQIEVTFRRDVLGHKTVDAWSGSVAGFAQRVTEALALEEEDTPAGSQSAGAASTARAEILAVLVDSGYNAAAAAELLGRAYREPQDADPDPDFAETLAGGHALVVQYGDCEVIGDCQCGRRFGTTTPDASLDTFVGPWERHTTTELTAATPAIGAS